ncbi:MAG: hypothetical protein EKK64_06625 [Neisseriaceae bacterium]|nr:MAG: hypothetical protein EKK64_06625 [Neisseriaceae bacterium]
MDKPFTDEEFREKINLCLNSLEDFQSLKISKKKIQILHKNKLHNTNGPAVIYKNGREEWYFEGKRHREDGPAVDSENIKIWYKKGLRHRENDPALIKDNLKVWYERGLKHRTSPLPAVEYYIENEKVSRAEWWNHGILEQTKDDEIEIIYENDLVKSIKTKETYTEFEEEKVSYLSDKTGRFWFKDDKLHRDEDDQPAAIFYNDVVVWYQYGLKHRTNGPAMEFSDGTEKWYSWNKLHRTDGPAITRPNGDNEWYENGKFIKCSSKIRRIKKWFKEESSLGFDIGLALFAIAFIIFYVFYILSLK